MAITPRQRIWRDRFEAVIGVAAPILDLMLNAGERASRLLGADDRDYYPIRPAGESLELDAPRAPQRSGLETVD
jgi:hypothetical protein